MSNGLILPTAAEASAALTGDLSDGGAVRDLRVPLTPVVPAASDLREWSEEDARAAAGLTGRKTSWVTSSVGDPLVFAENERRKINAILGDLSPLDIIWNRVLIAVWRAPGSKAIKRLDGTTYDFQRTDNNRDEDGFQGSVGLIVKMGPTAWLRDIDDKTGEEIYWPQKPDVGDWVIFARGYGTRYKLNDYPLILLDKETEAIKIGIPWPHAVDII